jgi:bacterioferritin (cytochrome b1)
MSVIPNTMPGFAGDPTGAAAIFAGNTTQSDFNLVITRLNSLLRGEISAAETYRNVLKHIAAGTHAENTELLRNIQLEHAHSCQSLRDRIRELGGEASDDSGVWGIWAQAVQGTLTLFGGDAGGLRALLEGEEHGVKDYESAIDELDATSAQLVVNQLLPAQKKHIGVLNEMLNVIAQS